MDDKHKTLPTSPLAYQCFATRPDGTKTNLPEGTIFTPGMLWDDPEHRPDPIRDLCVAFRSNPDPATISMIASLHRQVYQNPIIATAMQHLRR